MLLMCSPILRVLRGICILSVHISLCYAFVDDVLEFFVVVGIFGDWEISQSKMIFFVVFAISSPVFALSHGAFLPDMPLLACTAIGYMLLLTKQNISWDHF